MLVSVVAFFTLINCIDRIFFLFQSSNSSYYKWKNIGVDKIIKSCPTNTAAHEEAENLLAGYTNDLLAIICGDYVEESDKCEGIIGKIPEWKRPLRWQNFILPLIDLYDSIDDNVLPQPS